MNNLLLSELPHSVKIGGFEVEIKSDFKTSINFAEILRDNKIEENGKVNKALFLYYPILKNTTDNSSEHDKKIFIAIKDNIREAIDKMLWFYRCGDELETKGEGNTQKREIFSYSYDAKAIISDFKKEYNVNLLKDNIHWWEFKAYFNGLSEESEVMKRIRFRSVDITKLPKEQQEYYRKMKKHYEIPRDKEEVKQNSGLAALLRGGNTLDKLED